MPLAHQIILGVLLAGFVLYPLVLFYGWLVTRGWEYGPDGVMPQVQRPAEAKVDKAATTIDYREAA